MEYQFKEWLIQQGKPSAAKNYPQAINLVSQHYSNATGQKLNIYEITDQVLISEIAHAYSQSGKYSDYGYEQHSRFRAAINRYAEFFVQYQKPEILTPTIEEAEAAAPETNFAYEKDLQTAICAHISELFPNYRIFGGNSSGIEYSIESKRIDILLEDAKTGDLLAVELKSGTADYRVFGQVSMYMGLLMTKFPERKVSGVIVAGSVDPGLKHACTTTDRIGLKVYRMSVELDDA
ncbi:endonuclease NucS domain-containing protein [Polaromonas sp. SM01]|uniref:endonuclease NucS domain-containing protein n=1 Tax=Polaromonas sp. SM01 TaxID=3085630 RepID=UPI002981CA56|nr:endonuclease NucS domain-containing protein [Polaromonas sp. SM01]MDW5445066.1 endonuclease NucS [Polaromonas sp. SM01]